MPVAGKKKTPARKTAKKVAKPVAPAGRDAPDGVALAHAIRFLSAAAVERAQSGHPGMPMGAADIATVLWTRFLKFDARNPHWPDRDRFVLSAGHGSMLLYALLFLTGHADITIEDIKKFRQLGAKTAGHPEYGEIAGIETTAGPLGQGLGTAVGMALAERHLAARFGGGLVNHRIYTLVSDGDLMEGVGMEAAALAGHLRLSNLVVLHDDNEITIDGPKSLSDSTDMLALFRAFGWSAERIDGHDHEAIATALTRAQAQEVPVLISCRTKIGFGAPNVEGQSKAHGAPLGEEELKATKKALGWKAKDFTVPPEILDAWRLAGLRGRRERKAWEERLAAAPEKQRKEFSRMVAGDLPSGLAKIWPEWQRDALKEEKAVASRAASGKVLEKIAPALPELIGGSADLAGSTLTNVKGLKPIRAGDYGGRILFFGVREHGMAAMMNGMALHGLRPYGGTFLVFSDYCRPSIRMAAMMGLNVTYLFTHDSIGVGEDGPTHQPVEHLAALRAMPGLKVFRPACMVEAGECWQAALEHKGPSVMALSRQALPATVRRKGDKNLSAKGAYILQDTDGEPDIVLLASGSEVSLALEAASLLQKDGIVTRVVSAPCLELFEAAGEDYRERVLGLRVRARLAIEAGTGEHWLPYLGGKTGDEGMFLGMRQFGASGPAGKLFPHFGLTAKDAAEKVRARLERG